MPEQLLFKNYYYYLKTNELFNSGNVLQQGMYVCIYLYVFIVLILSSLVERVNSSHFLSGFLP